MTLFDDVATELMAATGASRVTVRLCEDGADPRLVAEVLAPGVGSMAGGTRDPIRTAPTYVFLETERRLLVQNDCREGEPAPPRSLIEHYRVYAQMLAPVFVGDQMVATISVHQQDATRDWSARDIDALSAARSRLEKALAI